MYWRFLSAADWRFLSAAEWRIQPVANIPHYAGVYEGFISPIEGRELSANEEGLIPVIVDAVFTSKEVELVITLGYADEKHDPEILFYGQSSDTLDAISSEAARRAIE